MFVVLINNGDGGNAEELFTHIDRALLLSVNYNRILK